MIVSQEMNIASNINYDVLGQFGNHTIVSSDNGSKMTLYNYNRELQSIVPYPIESPNRRAEVAGYVVHDSLLYIYYSYPDSNQLHLALQKVSLMENIILQEKVIAKSSANIRPDLPLVVSQDRTKHLVRLGSRSSGLQFYLFDVYSDTLVPMEAVGISNSRDNDFVSHLLTNQGDYFIMNTAGKSKDKKYTLYRNSISGNNQYEFTIPENLSDLSIRSNHNQVILTGLYRDQKELYQLGMFFLDLNQVSNANPDYKKVPFNEQTIRDFYGGETQRQAGIEDLRLQQVLLHHDGSLTLLMEQTKEIFRANMPGRNVYLPGAQSIDFYVENIIVGSVNRSFEPEWQRVLHKKQYSYDDDAIYSSYFLHENPSAIRLLYNDEIRRSNTISEYIVTATGGVQRRVLFNTDYSDLNLLIRNSTQVGPASTIIPSIKKNKLRLVQLNYE